MNALILNILVYCLTLFGLPSGFLQDLPSIQEDDTHRSLLVIRQYDGFCEGDTTLSDNCFSYTYPDDAIDEINSYITEHAKMIKELVIENPSGVIFDLELEALTVLETISMFGNDYDIDGLTRLPGQLFRLPHLRTIELVGVRFPSEKLERLRTKFPHISIPGDISEY